MESHARRVVVDACDDRNLTSFGGIHSSSPHERGSVYKKNIGVLFICTHLAGTVALKRNKSSLKPFLAHFTWFLRVGIGVRKKRGKYRRVASMTERTDE